MEICPVSKYCGGCQLQGIAYKKQLQTKQKEIETLFRKYKKIKPIIGMVDPLNYRNKVQVSFGYDESHNVICGNYVASTHTIVPVENCMICDEGANQIINSIIKLIIKYKISVFDEDVMKGCIRHILIRATRTGEYMVVLVTGSFTIAKKDLFIKDIIKYNKQVKTIVQNINNKRTSMILGNRNITLYGKGYIIDRLFKLTFRISPSSFYQVNKSQVEMLYEAAILAAKLNKDEVLIDAYCGTGTIGLVASRFCKNVIGVEINKDAIKDANINMKANKIKNVEFVCDDASRFMSKLARTKTNIDVVIMDPPRTGSDKKFMDAIFKLRPKKIVYVSCNPYTLKEDLNYLSKYYKVNSMQPVDMFPYTNHIEVVTGLSKI